MSRANQTGGQVVLKRAYARLAGTMPPMMRAIIPVMMSHILDRPGLIEKTKKMIMKMKPVKALRNSEAIVMTARSRSGSPGAKTATSIRRTKTMNPKNPLEMR